LSASSRGRRNRQRGQEGEREVCQILTDALGVKIQRLLGQERDGGVDIQVKPFIIDCKRRKRVANLYDWMAEAGDRTALRDMSQIPAIALRADGQKWLVVMELEDWIKLAREEISKA
jgi:hypothetical protein